MKSVDEDDARAFASAARLEGTDDDDDEAIAENEPNSDNASDMALDGGGEKRRGCLRPRVTQSFQSTKLDAHRDSTHT